MQALLLKDGSALPKLFGFTRWREKWAAYHRSCPVPLSKCAANVGMFLKRNGFKGCEKAPLFAFDKSLYRVDITLKGTIFL